MSSQLFGLIPYLSPGISIGINSQSEFFISSQISLGISFLDDHYDNPDEAIDYFVPSVSFGLRYFPNRPSEKLFKYTDFQATLLLHYVIMGFGRGKIKGIDNSYASVKNKFYAGHIILYNYEKELENSYSNNSLMAVFPMPIYELIPSWNWNEKEQTTPPTD